MTSGDTKASGLRPTRRTVVKGAAWAVPAVVVASAAPAAAASAPIIVIPPADGEACRLTGNSCRPYFQAVHFSFTFVNTTDANIKVVFTSFIVNGVSSDPIPVCADIPPGTHEYSIIANNNGNSGNGYGTLSFQYEHPDGYLVCDSVGTGQGLNNLPVCVDCASPITPPLACGDTPQPCP